MEARIPQVSIAVLAASSAALVCPAFGRASSRDVGFAGGSRVEQAQVREALVASSFDWNMLPGTVVVHIAPLDAGGYATPGNVFLDSRLLDAGEFSWGVVQHEFGHEVDFLMLHDDDRSILQDALGATAWCSQSDGLPHSAVSVSRRSSPGPTGRRRRIQCVPKTSEANRPAWRPPRFGRSSHDCSTRPDCRLWAR
jgi:hypothetical protein